MTNPHQVFSTLGMVVFIVVLVLFISKRKARMTARKPRVVPTQAQRRQEDVELQVVMGAKDNDSGVDVSRPEDSDGWLGDRPPTYQAAVGR